MKPIHNYQIKDSFDYAVLEESKLKFLFIVEEVHKEILNLFNEK